MNPQVKPVVIVGAGGFGREVLEIFKAQNKNGQIWDILGFIDEDPLLRGEVRNGYSVLGGMDWLREHNDRTLSCVVTISSPEARHQVVERINRIGVRFCNAIHPSVIMSESVELGEDVIICCGAALTVDIRIGNHVHININSVIGHDVVIGAYATISPIVSLSGHVSLGEGANLGTQSSVIPNVSIGRWSTIGAGAVVVRDIPEHCVAVGVPARVIKVSP